jgi:hypothetical protein
LLLLVRKGEFWREGRGSHLCDDDEGGECAALLGAARAAHSMRRWCPAALDLDLWVEERRFLDC